MKTILFSSFGCHKYIQRFQIIVAVVVLTSCVTHKDVVYFQDQNKTTESFKEIDVVDYLLKPNDELYIQISSLDDATSNNFFSSNGERLYALGSIQPYGAYLLSYSVDREGYLYLPVIGKVYVQGKTTSQVSEILKESLTNILSQPLVSVKLINRFVSVLGEVRIPGHYVFTQDKLTVYDAISLAGDITDYGDRKNAILVRNENGNNKRINIDLTSSDIFTSEYYYLRPNDIIYIEPLRKKFWNMREFPYTIILSTITTALLLYTTINNN